MDLNRRDSAAFLCGQLGRLNAELSAALVMAADSRILQSTRIGTALGARLQDEGVHIGTVAGAGLRNVEFSQLTLPVVTTMGGAEAVRRAIADYFGAAILTAVNWHATADRRKVPVFNVLDYGASFVITDGARMASGRCKVSGVTTHPVDGYWQHWVPDTLLEDFINQAVTNHRVYQARKGGGG